MAAPNKVEFVVTARDATRRAFSRIRRSISGLAGRLAALAGAGALAAAAKSALDLANNITNASRALGTTTTELQAIRAFGSTFGIQADDIDDAFHSINTARAESMRGNDEMMQSMRRLGISMDFARARNNPIDFLLQMSAQVQRLGGNVTDVADDLNRVFGEDVTRRILPLLKAGPGGIIGGVTEAVAGGQVAAADKVQSATEASVAVQQKLLEAQVLGIDATTAAVATTKVLIEKVEVLTEAIQSIPTPEDTSLDPAQYGP